MGKNGKQKSNKGIMIAAMAFVALLAVVVIVKNQIIATPDLTAGVKTVKDADIVIPVKSVTEKAVFYPAEINGIKLEVLAVKAPDGTIRTAFNTCQVCYSSGKGYYKQEGDKLICQNCKNQFSMGDVEVTRGGCNPVPITSEYKTVDTDSITISKDFLSQATVIFQNWKN